MKDKRKETAMHGKLRLSIIAHCFWLAALLLSVVAVLSPAAADTVSVPPGDGTLAEAILDSSDGDELILTDGWYHVTETIRIPGTMTIRAREGTSPKIAGGTQIQDWEVWRSGPILRTPWDQPVSAMTENGIPGQKASSGLLYAQRADGNRLFSSGIPEGLAAGTAQVMTYGAADTNWQSTLNTVTSGEAGSLSFSGSTKRGISAGTPFEILNDPCFLDRPGDFVWDGGYLYYYPRSEDWMDSVICAAVTCTVFRVSGTLMLTGVEILCTSGSAYTSGGDYVQVAAVEVSGTLLAEGCRFRGIGANAVMSRNGRLTVRGCVFRRIGASAVYATGRESVVAQNRMTDIGYEYTGGAVTLDCADDCLISHNTISGCTRWGINLVAAGSTHGYGNVIEYNDLSDCNTRTSDSGLIYLYRMDGARADRRNTIRYNAVHDSICIHGMGFGIYLDDNAGFTDVIGNRIWNLRGAPGTRGFLMGAIMVKGTGSVICDNVIAGNEIAEDYRDGAGNNNAVFVVQEIPGYTTRDNTFCGNMIGKNGNNRLFRVIDDSDPFDMRSDRNILLLSFSEYGISGPGVWNMASWRQMGFDRETRDRVPVVLADPEHGDFGIANPEVFPDQGDSFLLPEMFGADPQIVPLENE